MNEIDIINTIAYLVWVLMFLLFILTITYFFISKTLADKISEFLLKACGLYNHVQNEMMK